jgi:ankyrin repeat protein
MKHLLLFSIVATTSTLQAMEADSAISLIPFGRNVKLLDRQKPESETNINPVPANCSSLHHILFHIVANPSYYNKQTLIIAPISIVDKSANEYVNHPNVIRHIISYISGNRHQDKIAKALKLPGVKNYLKQSTYLYVFFEQLQPHQINEYIVAGADPHYDPSTSRRRALPSIAAVHHNRINKPKDPSKTFMESLQEEVDDIKAEVDKDRRIRSAIINEDEDCILAALTQDNMTPDQGLDIAMRMNKAKAVSLLLQLGADPRPHLQKQIKNEAIFNALCSALDYMQDVHPMARPNSDYVATKSLSMVKPVQDKLQEALKSGDPTRIIKTIEEEKITLFEALRIAIALNLERSVLILLAAGADPKPHLEKPIKNEVIFTALCSALTLAKTNAATLLAEHTPEQSKKLQLALASKKEKYVLDVLQQENINLDVALKLAATLQNEDAMLLLVTLGASLKDPKCLYVRDQSEPHPLIKKNLETAIKHKNLKKMEWLFKNGANPNTHLYDTVLMIMSNISDNILEDLQKDLDMIELMCNHGAYNQEVFEIIETMENMPERLLASLKKGQALHHMFKK